MTMLSGWVDKDHGDEDEPQDNFWRSVLLGYIQKRK